MRNYIIAILMFLSGFILSEFGPRKVLIVYPSMVVKTGERGIEIDTCSIFDPFYARKTTAIISKNDWYRFCPLEHKDIQ